MATTTIDLPPLDFRAAVGTVNQEKRTVELTFSTGADVVRSDYNGKFIERLSLQPAHVRLGRLNAGAPLLNAHSGFSLADQIGVVESGSATVDGQVGRARVRFSRRADVEPIFRDVLDHVVRNVSVGYRVHRFEETRGAAGAPPVRLATDWEPFEISLVPMGADPGARIRGAQLGALNRCVIVNVGSVSDADRVRTLRYLRAVGAGAPDSWYAAAVRRGCSPGAAAALAAAMGEIDQILLR